MPVQAVEAFFIPGRLVEQGEQFADADPIVKDRPHLFSKVEEAPKPRKAAARKAAAKAEDS